MVWPVRQSPRALHLLLFTLWCLLKLNLNIYYRSTTIKQRSDKFKKRSDYIQFSKISVWSQHFPDSTFFPHFRHGRNDFIFHQWQYKHILVGVGRTELLYLSSVNLTADSSLYCIIHFNVSLSVLKHLTRNTCITYSDAQKRVPLLICSL